MKYSPNAYFWSDSNLCASVSEKWLRQSFSKWNAWDFYALLLWLMILFPNICELLQVANIMDEWRTARLFPVLSPECDIKTRWRNFFLMWFYRVKEVAILHVNINSPEQSRINADSHFTVCLLSSSLPLTKTSNSGAHQKLQRQQLRGGQLLGVIEADWLGKCQMTNAARGLPDRGDNASPAQPQPWSADTSKKNNLCLFLQNE